MHEIFISYSSRHRDLTQTLAAAIEAQYGPRSVWWDQAGLYSGDRFSPVITRALDNAKVVVVIWTQGAVTSDWVYAEAVRGAAQRKIVTVRDPALDPDTIPLPFNVFHACEAHHNRAVLDGIAKVLAGEASPLPSAVPGPGFRAFLLDSKQEALPAWAFAKGPASLLLARHRLVPFADFHDLRAEFVRWATGTPADALGAPVLGRLVHGPAGLGKTRALIEIADELTRAHGWLAGFVPPGVRVHESAEVALERLILSGRDAAGLMLIVDYAESRREDVVWLADRLIRRAETIAKPARLVLLSRGNGVWWRELVLATQSLQMLCSLGGEAYDEIAIPEDIPVRDRRALFDAAVTAFLPYRSALAPKEGPLRPPADDFWHRLDTEPDYARPLAVQIAALLHVADSEVAADRPGIAYLLDRILGLEYAHWGKTLPIYHKPNGKTAIHNGVAQVTLAGATASAPAAEALIARDPFYNQARDIDVPRIRHALALICPGDNDGLAGLEPDLDRRTPCRRRRRRRARRCLPRLGRRGPRAAPAHSHRSQSCHPRRARG